MWPNHSKVLFLGQSIGVTKALGDVEKLRWKASAFEEALMADAVHGLGDTAAEVVSSSAGPRQAIDWSAGVLFY